MGLHRLAVAEAPSAADASTALGADRLRPSEANFGMLDRRYKGVSILPAGSEPSFDFR